MKVAIYARVSTSSNGQSPEMQTRELREYCERRGWQLAGEYVDLGISGTKEKRPELDRLMTAAHRRQFDAVICWKFDRHGASLTYSARLRRFRRSASTSFPSASRWTRPPRPARWSSRCWAPSPNWNAR